MHCNQGSLLDKKRIQPTQSLNAHIYVNGTYVPTTCMCCGEDYPEGNVKDTVNGIGTLPFYALKKSNVEQVHSPLEIKSTDCVHTLG
jgi:hypothetical protein